MEALNKSGTYTAEDYFNTSEDDRIELIDGKFYAMASPSLLHQRLSMELSGRIWDYIRKKGGDCQVFAAPFDVWPDPDDDKTVVVPDISVICDKEKLWKRGCKGAPDWIIEIVSPTTASHDYIRKLNIFRKAGVRLYWIVDYASKAIVVTDFSKDDEDSVLYSFDDTVPVDIYEDLKIDFKDIYDGLPAELKADFNEIFP